MREGNFIYAKVHALVYISLSKSLFQLKPQIWFQTGFYDQYKVYLCNQSDFLQKKSILFFIIFSEGGTLMKKKLKNFNFILEKKFFF